MISNFFIDRPLFATVVSAFIVIAGLAAFRELPVAMYPNIAPPQISVTTVYPGASAEVIAETVAAPLEQALNGVEDMLYMLLGQLVDGELAHDRDDVRGGHGSRHRAHQRAEPRAERDPAAARGGAAARRHGRRKRCRAS